MIEAQVSRLYGHSSSSGAQRTASELDCIAEFEQKLLAARAISPAEIERVSAAAKEEAESALRQALSEAKPTADDVYLHTYAPSPVDAVYPRDYTGLP